MAIKVDGTDKHPSEVTATGNSRDTGTPVSLPPTKTADEMRSTSCGRGSLGSNGYDGPVSLAPGQTLKQTGINIDPKGGDPVRDLIIASGSARTHAGDQPAKSIYEGVGESQLRPVDSTQKVPDSYGMESARSRQPSYPGPAASIPASLDNDEAQPVRKPSA